MGYKARSGSMLRTCALRNGTFMGTLSFILRAQAQIHPTDAVLATPGQILKSEHAVLALRRHKREGG